MINRQTTDNSCFDQAIRHDPAFGIAPQIIRRNLPEAQFGSVPLDDVPDQSLANAVTPALPGSADAAK